MTRKMMKKVVATTLTATMAISMSTMAFAAEGDPNASTASEVTQNAVGEQHTYDTDAIYSVYLPTDKATTLAFKVDPKGLMKSADSANAAKYTSTTGVFFTNASDYTESSDKVYIKNYSSKAVNISITGKVITTDTGMVVTDSAAGAQTGTDKLVYFGLQQVKSDDTASGAAVALTTAGRALTGTAVDNSEQYKWVASGSAVNNVQMYKYQYDSTLTAGSGKPAQFFFKLTGAANKNADWSNMTAAPKVELTYDVQMVGSSTSYVSTNTLTAASNSLTLNMPSGVTLSNVKLTYADGTGAITLTDQYTLNGTTFTVPAANISAWLGLSPAYNKIVLTFSDSQTETITLQQ